MSTCSEATTALAGAPLRRPLVLVAVRTEPALARRLGALGVRPGAHVELLHRTAGGGRVLSVAGTRIALDKAVLQQLDAEVVE